MLCKVEEVAEDVSLLWPKLSQAIDQAVNNLMAMRLAEGANIQKDMIARIDKVGRIRPFYRGAGAANRRRIPRETAQPDARTFERRSALSPMRPGCFRRQPCLLTEPALPRNLCDCKAIYSNCGKRCCQMTRWAANLISLSRR